MDSYLPKVQYHAEQDWQYRRTTVDPSMSRTASLLREHKLAQRRTRSGDINPRRSLRRWVGEQLIRVGHRLAQSQTVAAS